MTASIVLIAALLAAFPASAAFRGDGPTLDEPYARAHRRALDWREVAGGPERVIFIGEYHEDPYVARELAAHMDELVAAGITHLALEQPVGEDLQGAYDAFMRGEADAGGLAKTIEGYHTRHKEWIAAAFGVEFYAKYVGVLSAARDADPKPAAVALDIPQEEKYGLQRDCGSEPRPERCGARGYAFIPARDERMAARVAGILARDPKARVLVWVGAIHAGHENQPAALARRGHPSRSYYFAVNGDGCADAVKALGRESERVLIDTRALGPSGARPHVVMQDMIEQHRFDACLWVPGPRPEPLRHL
ncbi:MAG: hypothetical protein HY059_09245 [Proteobacteria bacterium]|nr:hypothetical protein [Pseudomonadota bacterium]